MTNSEFISLNKFSKSGNFLAKFPVHEISENSNSAVFKEYKELMVTCLADDELAENWRIKLPKKIFVKNVDSNNITTVKRVKSFHTFNINMSQLPFHLMNKLSRRYENNNLSHYEANDNIYKYRIMPSEIDDDILKLARMLNSNRIDKNMVKRVVSDMKRLNLTGWVLNKANNVLA